MKVFPSQNISCVEPVFGKQPEEHLVPMLHDRALAPIGKGLLPPIPEPVLPFRD